MDFQIRLFDDSEWKIFTHYFGSRFVCRSNASALVEQILDMIKYVEASKMAMLGMDEPYVNWLIFEKLNIIKYGYLWIIFSEPCFRNGFFSVEWRFEKIMKSIFKLFNKSPARGDTEGDNEVLNGDNSFAKYIC